MALAISSYNTLNHLRSSTRVLLRLCTAAVATAADADIPVASGGQAELSRAAAPTVLRPISILPGASAGDSESPNRPAVTGGDSGGRLSRTRTHLNLSLWLRSTFDCGTAQPGGRPHITTHRICRYTGRT